MHITELNLISSTGKGFKEHHYIDTREHEFHFIIKGHGIFTNQGTPLPMEDNCLFYSTPSQGHTTENHLPGGYLTFYFIRFLVDKSDKPLMDEVARVFKKQNPITVSAATHPFFERIKLDIDTGDRHLQQAATLRFRAFIHELCSDRTVGTKGSVNPHIMAAIRLLQMQVHHRFSLDDLARQVGLEKSYLIRLFRRETGTTPQKYLMKLKTDTACYLLRYTDRPVNKIAEQLGFYDEFYFSRTFKKVTGLAPSQYRG
jgi:AraC-like DNA-binding protein